MNPASGIPSPSRTSGTRGGTRKGEMVRSRTIITEANGLLRPIHDRMPVMLSRDAEPLWLDDDLQDLGLLQ